MACPPSLWNAPPDPIGPVLLRGLRRVADEFHLSFRSGESHGSVEPRRTTGRRAAYRAVLTTPDGRSLALSLRTDWEDVSAVRIFYDHLGGGPTHVCFHDPAFAYDSIIQSFETMAARLLGLESFPG